MSDIKKEVTSKIKEVNVLDVKQSDTLIFRLHGNHLPQYRKNLEDLLMRKIHCKCIVLDEEVELKEVVKEKQSKK